MIRSAKTEQEDKATAARTLYSRMQRVKETVGQGIFDTFLSYEIREFDSLVDNTLAFVRISPIRSSNAGESDLEGSAISGGLLSKDPKRLYQSDTIIGCIANMAVTGPSWLFVGTAPMQWRPEGSTEGSTTWGARIEIVGYRGLYLFSLCLLAGFCLIVLALSGAIISRLSALEMGGIERAPLKDVFLFAYRRLWIFIKAPLTPFLILLAIGIVLAVAGLIGAIPFLGAIVFGILFIFILAVAFILMLLLLGILGGFNLLYPTIAVEGSDAFDAMSRSFAYVYSRPWRLLFYSILSLIYGVITFLFVSFAIYLVLSVAHTFTGWGVNFFGYNQGSYTGLPKLETLWPAPDFANLLAPANWYAMSWSEYIGSMFLHFWVYLLISAGGAYVISYYFSSNTIIYLLLRHSVDGQTTSDIFLDEPATNLISQTSEAAPPPAPPSPPVAPPAASSDPSPSPASPYFPMSSCTVFSRLFLSASRSYNLPSTSPEWRNWQTRWTQNPVLARVCGFNSLLRQSPIRADASIGVSYFCGAVG